VYVCVAGVSTQGITTSALLEPRPQPLLV
jgi:hypothetical protein